MRVFSVISLVRMRIMDKKQSCHFDPLEVLDDETVGKCPEKAAMYVYRRLNPTR